MSEIDIFDDPSVETEAPSFRDDCVMTWMAEQEAAREGAEINRREENARYRRALRELARAILEIEIPDLIHPDDPGGEYTFDGIRFGLYRGDLFAIQPCDYCGCDEQHLIHSRADLGAFLSGASSSYNHRCPGETRRWVEATPSADEVFLAALRVWMNANVTAYAP